MGQFVMKRNEIILLIFCLLVGFFLRFYHFDHKSLWIDEIYTYNDSRDDFSHQLKFYKENPTFLHPPLFYILTHQFYPFKNPERDLRIIPLIFGILSIPLIYLLARQFFPSIALACTLSLTFMAYHISLSQDGRSYPFLMFTGMSSLYFFMKYLKTLHLRYLLPVAFFYAILFHTSYSAIPFIIFSQLLWFYRINEKSKFPRFSSFLFLNGFTLLLCLPWILFILLNYKGQSIYNVFHTEDPGSFWFILSGVVHDWMPHLPLMIISFILLIVYPFFAKSRNNALILLASIVFPIGSLYLFCKFTNYTHFVTSRYFVNFLPLFFITIYLSIDSLQKRFNIINNLLNLRFLFIILLIGSNLIILPFYYQSEKQDIRGLTAFLKANLREGDGLFISRSSFMVGILHYLGIPPDGRHYLLYRELTPDRRKEHFKPFILNRIPFTIHYSKSCCAQYISKEKRLWIIASKQEADKIIQNSPCIFKGYFEGSFLNFNRFPVDADIYLFLWDPKSPKEKGIDIPIE